jgi:hypothetical protein
MKQIILLMISSLFYFTAQAQSLEVVSHYPESAYVINRLLPFVVRGDDDLRVQAVGISNGPTCESLIDPFYPNTFHIFCRTVAVVDLSIRVSGSAGEESLQVFNVSVALQRAPRDEMDGGSP